MTEISDRYRTRADAFARKVAVFGPAVPVPANAPLQDRLLGLLGRDPRWSA